MKSEQTSYDISFMIYHVSIRIQRLRFSQKKIKIENDFSPEYRAAKQAGFSEYNK